jgi:hypothetical protein
LLAGFLELEIKVQSGLLHAMYFIATRCFFQHISWEVMQSFPNVGAVRHEAHAAKRQPYAERP